MRGATLPSACDHYHTGSEVERRNCTGIRGGWESRSRCDAGCHSEQGHLEGSRSPSAGYPSPVPVFLSSHQPRAAGMQPHLQASLTGCRACPLWVRALLRAHGLPPTLWFGLCGLWPQEGGLQSTECWTAGRGQGAGKGRGQTSGFSKVKEIYFLRSRQRKWAPPRPCSALVGPGPTNELVDQEAYHEVSSCLC